MTAQKAGRGPRSRIAAPLSSGRTAKEPPSLCRDSNTDSSEPSVTASRKAAPYVLTATALGLFLAILAAAGYAAEHVPTPVALVVVWLAIGVVFVRLMDGRPS